MTADQWAVFMFLVALWATFAIGVIVGRQWMRNIVAKALEDAVKEAQRNIAVIQDARRNP